MQRLISVFAIGIIATFVLVLIFPSQEQTQSKPAFIPDPTNHVVDAADALSPAVEDQLNQVLSQFKEAQIAVLVVDSTSPLPIENYGIEVAEAWKVGDEGTDNGAIIILAVKDRKVRIEVGYGLEGQIPDAVAGRIIDESMIPFLKQSDWDAAITAGVQALIARIKK